MQFICGYKGRGMNILLVLPASHDCDDGRVKRHLHLNHVVDSGRLVSVDREDAAVAKDCAQWEMTQQ